MDKFINDIKTNSGEYGSIPFWSWNDKLNKEDLIRQIHDMKRLNMKGFFMHARSGLETEYLSDEWYECITACIEEAKKLDMEAWAYDENGWPSGFAGGKLLTCDENYAHWLDYKVLDHFDNTAFAVYELCDNKCRRVTKDCGIKEYHTIYRMADDSYVDTMNPRITKEFIELTYADYEKKCGDDFGSAMPGFFTDEPQYYRWHTVWSDMMLTEFESRYDYDVKDGLLALFVNYENSECFRFDYYKLCNHLFTENFIKLVYQWCEERGAQITGHAIEEKFLVGQMWCCGGIMPFYEYMSIPGVDYLGKSAGNDVSHKQVGSVAAQLGRKKVMSEMFACCGWDITPLRLKQVAEHQYYGGVNMMCQHLYPLSIRGQRKRDYPCFYSEHNPWQSALEEFNTYFNRLGYTTSRGKEKADILVIHPIRSAYMDYFRDEVTPELAELEANFGNLTTCLSQNQLFYHYGDETLMAKYARVEGNRIIIGECSYDKVVLPKIKTLDRTTADILKEYLANGGKLAVYGDTLPTYIEGRKADLDWLVPNATLGDYCDENEIKVRYNGAEALMIRVQARCLENGKRLYYILNLSHKEEYKNVVFEVKGVDNMAILDLETLEIQGVNSEKTGNGIKFTLDFETVQSYILIEEDAEIKAKKDLSAAEHTAFKVSAPIENSFTLDYARISYDGKEYSDIRPIVRIKDNLLFERYEGKVWLKFEFELESVPCDVNCAIERLTSQKAYVNGTEITISETDWWYDRHISANPITSLLREGINEIVLEIDYFQRDYVYHVLYGGVSESLRNCLCFDTEIESIYLFGDFEVMTEKDKYESHPHNYLGYTGSFTVRKTEGLTDLENIVENGYPFFKGDITVECEYTGGGKEFYLNGVYSCAEVYLNGKLVKKLLFTNHCTLEDVKVGDIISCKVYQSPFNLLGVHHRQDIEVYAAPDLFSFEKEWDGDKCDGYTDRYALQKFSIK
ncbi:MAG: hypothetical protein IKU52_04180 [Clostridia bacterium]|nr:hypothetical protein [Clostridia bacterium]